MAPTMKHIAKKCFPNAIQVTDCFHVQKLAIEMLQDFRIKHRWEFRGVKIIEFFLYRLPNIFA